MFSDLSCDKTHLACYQDLERVPLVLWKWSRVGRSPVRGLFLLSLAPLGSSRAAGSGDLRHLSRTTAGCLCPQGLQLSAVPTSDA